MSSRYVGDWGTSRLRLFRLDGDTVVGRREGPGIGQLETSPAEALLATLGEWVDAAREGGIALCGMAGSRNGLIEAPYMPCPAEFDDWTGRIAVGQANGIEVRIASGLSAANFAGAPDVMRGEETQIFGAIAKDPALAAGRRMLVLPGTHSKWVALEDGRVDRFHTAFTGELFALLRDRSTLARAGTASDGRDEGFSAGLVRIRETQALLASLFEARAAQLLDGRSHSWALGFLSGLAIGAEMAELTRLARVDGEIVLIGGRELCTLYQRALAAFGHSSLSRDGDDCVLAGLVALERTRTA